MHQELCISTTKPQITQLKQWAKEPGVWRSPVILVLGRRRRDCKCEASLGWVVRPCIKFFLKNRLKKLIFHPRSPARGWQAREEIFNVTTH
jgi:hypothetical protein